MIIEHGYQAFGHKPQRLFGRGWVVAVRSAEAVDPSALHGWLEYTAQGRLHYTAKGPPTHYTAKGKAHYTAPPEDDSP